MKTSTVIMRISVLALLAACVCVMGLPAQAQQTLGLGASSAWGPQQQSRLHVPPAAQHSHSSTYRYLASEEGRAMMQAAGRPISKYLNDKFGVPSATAVEKAHLRLQKIAAQPQATEENPAKSSVPCNASAGARFNLEPRANAE